MTEDARDYLLESDMEKFEDQAWEVMKGCNSFNEFLDIFCDECDWRSPLSERDDLRDHFRDMWDEWVESTK